MSKLSMHISMEEFIRSDKAIQLGIDNTLPPELLEDALETCAMGERIRAFLSSRLGRDVPIVLSSGYRCPPLDLAIRKRPKTGDHSLAKAMDFRADTFGTPYEIAKALAPMISVLGIGQLIYECPVAGHEWVHASTRIPDKIVNRVITISPEGPMAGIQVIEG